MGGRDWIGLGLGGVCESRAWASKSVDRRARGLALGSRGDSSGRAAVPVRSSVCVNTPRTRSLPARRVWAMAADRAAS